MKKNPGKQERRRLDKFNRRQDGRKRHWAETNKQMQRKSEREGVEND